MLYTRIQSQSFFVSGDEDFLSVFLFRIYGHAGHLVQ